MTRVLVVEDEPAVARTLRISLTAHGYDVDIAKDGTRALMLTAANHPDVVLLDLGLPDLDGIEVLRRIRQTSTVPVVILSVRDAEQQKIAALDAGADDYVTKPFSIGELLARLRAATRRKSPTPAETILNTAHFQLDLSDKRATVSDEEIHLTPIEWALVDYLVRSPNRLVPQREILEAVWGDGTPHETSYLRVHIGHIRQKLEPTPSRPRYFVTEPGMGYRFLLPTGDAETTRQ